MGADDYVTKPFSSQELVARVKSQLRRYLQLGDMGSVNKENTLINGGLKLDLDAMQLSVDGDLIKLTAKELKILEFLMRNAGIVFSADKIYENVWNEAPYAVENTVMVMADGKKMYRVFQNLIDNAIKYAMQGTRVFIDLEKIDQKAFVSIKNTAGYKMAFTADEILQRFSRGDISRTTEGYGLGLSIVESFTQVCGGRFLLNVDGDLFKVTLQFNEIKSEMI